ncbi:MAG: radical SAM protein [Chitinispirillales bacterium]|jgi:hypothetical protein|nr:radical SAM protein [Chitinispirillales bacterium]
MKTALVINPYVCDFKLYDEWMHPLGLYFLIGRLQSAGFDTRYINCLSPKADTKKFGTGEFPWIEIKKPPQYSSIRRRYKLYGICAEEFRNSLEQCASPDIICIGSMMTYWLPGVSETIRQARLVHPKVPVAIGGIGAILFGDYIRSNHPDVYVIDKETDIAGVRLGPRVFEHFLRNGSLLTGLKAADIKRHGPVLCTLGCPLSCEYCASKTLQPRFSVRPVKQIVEEIKFLAQERGINDFAFYDDALLVEPQNTVIPLARELGSLKDTLRFHTPNGLHLKYVNNETLNCLKALNVTTLRFGYESAGRRYLQATGQKISINILNEKAALLNNAGLAKTSAAYVMAGLPGQSVKDVLEEIDIVVSAGLRVKPVFVSPIPQTTTFDYYSRIYPQITSDPLWHNDTFFITKIAGWSEEAAETVKRHCTDRNR